METISDRKKLQHYIETQNIMSNFSHCRPHFLLLHYAPRELLTTPFAPSPYLQFIVEGELLLYDMPNEESTVILHTSYNEVSLLGEVELMDARFTPFFVEAATDVYTVALYVEQHRAELLEDPAFLRRVCLSLCDKLNGAVSATVSLPLRDRVVQYIRRTGTEQPITGIARLAKDFNVSRRQLLRVLKELCEEGVLEHRQKGVYDILKIPTL